MKSIVLLITLLITLSAQSFPRIGNYYLSGVNISDADSLARCDFLVLDHMVSRESSEVIDSVRKLNPDIKIIAYIVSQEINPSYANWNGSLAQSMLKEISDDWYLKNSDGEQVVFWPGTKMLNIAAGQPEVSSLQWNRYLAGIVNDSILNDERWDGVYLDNCWNRISWIDPNVDINNDGIADEPRVVDSLWESGMNLMLDLIRDRHPDKLVVGNGGYRYKKQLNGALYEDFPHWGGWWGLTDIYLDFDSSSYGAPFNLINTTTENDGIIDYQEMRFGLTSTLMGNGYFSYDYGANDHSQHWWFDEYSVELGAPTGSATVHDVVTTAEMDFENGADGWKVGTWKQTTSITTENGNSFLHASTSGEEIWNELIRSPELTIAEGAHLKLTFDLKVESADSGADMFANLRIGSEWQKDIGFGVPVPISTGMDTTISLYTDSAFAGSGYAVFIGLKHGGTVTIDNIVLESDEQAYMTRSFEKGLVVVNPSSKELTLSFPGYSRFEGIQDPVHNNGESAGALTLAKNDGIILKTGSTAVTPHAPAAEQFRYRMNSKGIQLTFSGSSVKRVSLVGLNGRTLMSKEAVSTLTIPTTGIAKGTYILTVDMDGKTKATQILVK